MNYYLNKGDTNNFAVNIWLAKDLGLDEAILLGALVNFNHIERGLELIENTYFQCTVEDIEKLTTLSAHRQRNALINLKKVGYVDYKVQGLPAKRYIRLIPIAFRKTQEN